MGCSGLQVSKFPPDLATPQTGVHLATPIQTYEESNTPGSVCSTLRLTRGPDDRKNCDKYIATASRALALEAAAEAWSAGVEWNEALGLAERAVKKVKAIIGPVAKPKSKGKAKAKGKSRARA